MAIIYHPDYEKHIQQYEHHPESPERLIATVRRLKTEGLFNPLVPKPATEVELGFVHTRDHIDRIKDYNMPNYYNEAYIRPDTYSIAALAAGGALFAAKYTLENGKPSFALLRPPGHHACVNRAMGFCYFNNITISAEWLTRQKKKIAIIDLDVHHGNGTSEFFYDRSDVLFISTHLYPFYPGTGAEDDIGEGDGEGYTINIPFGPGCGDSSFNMAFDEIIEPAVLQFKPDMILVSLGGDSHYNDALVGLLTLSTPGYLSLANRIIKMVDGKCAFMLEGGYDPESLSEMITGIVAGFENKQIKLKYTKVMDTDYAGIVVIKRVKGIQKKFWKL